MTQFRRHLAVAAAAFAILACAGKMTRVTRAIDRYEASLSVEVAADTSTPLIGELLGLTVILSNVGHTDDLHACLGPAKSYAFLAFPLAARDGKEPVGGKFATNVHPYCYRRFHLRPGEHIAWREEILVPDIGEGDADLTLSVQIVHPRDCDRYGCYDTMIDAKSIRLNLNGSRDEGASRQPA